MMRITKSRLLSGKKILAIILFFCFASIISAQQKRALTIDDIWSMKRIGSFDVSHDGKTIVFSVSEYSMENNKGQSDVYLIESDGSNLRPLKNSAENESSPQFRPGSDQISFSREGNIWLCDSEGKNEKQLTTIYTGASGAVWSNDGKKLLFVSSVYPECASQDCNKEKDEAERNKKHTGQIFTELMYRHWNNWRGQKRSHLFLFDTNLNEYIDLTLNGKYDVPPIALGSANDYSLSPDGKEAAFTMNDSDMLATSTNNDVYIINLADAFDGIPVQFRKISESKGNDNQPKYSPDGKYIAFRSMVRAGFEADKQRLALYDRSSGKINYVSQNLDISIGEMIWSPDSKYIYYTAANEINNSIFRINVETGKNEVVFKNRVNSGILLSADGKKLFFKQQRSNLPYEIFSINPESPKLKQITHLNSELLEEIEMNEIQTFWCEGAEGTKVQSILVKPPFFDSNKKYPLIFLIHGGPQGHWTDDFHYRWNLQMFSARGYIVVAPNPRGSTGYGQKFTDEISRDWGGKVYIDLINAYEYALDKFGFIDKQNTFAAGASYGGYMINWIEGHNDYFNALVSHDGVFNMESMYGSTEELWFPEWEMGGTPWDNRAMYQKWSPHMFVKNFKTPMLIVHSAFDFRISESQAFELFTSLQKMGVDSKFLYFPDESHFVLKPQNSKFWWNTIFDWFEEHKK